MPNQHYAMADIEAVKKIFHSLKDLYDKKDIPALVNCYSDDCIFMANGAPALKGQEGIKQFLAMPLNLTFESTGADFVQLADNVIIYTGCGVIIYPNGDRRAFKDVHVYKKVNGQWKIFRDVSNNDTA